MPTGGTLRFSEHEVLERKQMERRLDELNVIKFRARIESSRAADVHREFSGGYFPRFRSMYISEIKERNRKLVLVPIAPEDVYRKDVKGEGDDYYYTEDFVMGAKIRIEDKVFVITDVDRSRLRYKTRPRPEGPPKVHKATALDRIREKVRRRAGAGDDGRATIRRLGKHFRILDDSGDRKLSVEEFEKAIGEYGVELTADEIRELYDDFDQDDDGAISYEEFMEAIRGPMSEPRRMCVVQAFKKIDYNQDGVLTIDDFKHFYNAKYHPKVMNGEITEDEAIAKFVARFEDSRANGVVTWDEFQDYYNAVSASIDDDEHFVFMMERAWNLDKRNATKTPFR
eukprot:TRINITY_DN66545_c0_g1_i1.p2 TRINITY_DN66545_c0_g1~~TRINITY_DN66545_c0_g1_i1.p2  ORF type:complete len:369 (+),score=125.54 TRINITY_DN66545_c0_g1_i1:86-1108(+)